MRAVFCVERYQYKTLAAPGLLAAIAILYMYTQSGMRTDDFPAGIRYEVANRAFALRTVERLSRRFEGSDQQAFWLAYLKLEQFSAPHYRALAERLEVDSHPGLWTRFRAAVVASDPGFMMERTLRSMLSRTEIYVGRLNQLQSIGPADESEFLDYMVAQEALQVEMLRLAVSGQYGDAAAKVEAFVDRHRDR